MKSNKSRRLEGIIFGGVIAASITAASTLSVVAGEYARHFYDGTAIEHLGRDCLYGLGGRIAMLVIAYGVSILNDKVPSRINKRLI